MTLDSAAAQLIKSVSHEYNLAAGRVERLSGGFSNTSYFIETSNEQYVLTVFNEASYDEVVVLIRLLQWLADKGFSTTRVQTTRDGRTSTRYEDKSVLVKAFISGKVIDDWQPDLLFQVGAEMARLHQLPVPDFLPAKHLYESLFNAVFESRQDQTYTLWLQERLKNFRPVNHISLKRSIVHGDIFWDNVLFEDGHLKAIIDFECACMHPAVFDMGMAIIGTCSSDEVIDWDKAKMLLAGYATIRALNSAEIRSLQAYMVYTAAITSCWRFWKTHIDMSHSTEIRDYRQMVGIANTIRPIPEAEFIDMLLA